VDVYLLYDEIGSYRLPARYIEELESAGVRVAPFHSTRGHGNRFQLNFRNHRKLVVVDGERGWIGGLNIGDEYIDGNDRLGPWRDTHLRIVGPAVLKLQLSFVEDWHWATSDFPELDWDPHEPQHEGAPVLILASGPADRFETASLMVQQAIHAANERFWISSPYFVPDEGVQNMLKLAALGGVDVRVLIPERPDNRLAYFAAYAFIGPLLDAGVKIYRYESGFLHSKACLVDDAVAAVGTVNLDNRSFRLNFELTAIGLDRRFAASVEAMFLDDFEHSRRMSQDEAYRRPLWFRVVSRAAYLFAPLL
jgi:cardiolipin synthase A/B